jgi:superfamily II helicase
MTVGKERARRELKDRIYNRFFANALPADVFKYFSNSIALLRSVKAIAVLILHGVNLEVCTHLP